MAIIGGAGNPVGGSFTGPAEAIEIIGDHAYAYSGKYTASTTPQTVLDFTTGNYYFVGTIQFNGWVDPTDPTAGARGSMIMTMNGTDIMVLKTDGLSETMPASERQDIIIPSYTEITAIVDSTSEDVAMDGYVLLTGRIYRTRD